MRGETFTTQATSDTLGHFGAHAAGAPLDGRRSDPALAVAFQGAI
jgi:hypothetical protein